MVGGQDQGLGLLVVGVAAGVLAAVLLAGLALEAQLAVLGVAVTVEIGAAAVGTAQGLGEYRRILPCQTKLSHYPGLTLEAGQIIGQDSIPGSNVPKPSILSRRKSGAGGE